MGDDRRRRRPQRQQPARGAPQQPIGVGKLRGEYHRVGVNALATVGVQRLDSIVAAIQPRYGCTVAEFDTGIRCGGGQRIGQCPHPTARKVHARNGVHVGDDGVDRERPLRRNPRVQRLEGEDAVQPRIGDEPFHHPVPAPEAAERRQPGELRSQQR